MSQPILGSEDVSGGLVTLCDMVSALLDRCMGNDDERTHRLLTTAAQTALRDIAKRHKWKYYNQTVRFTASAPQTLTVSYTESDRTMVITGVGQWPADAIYGEIVYGDSLYTIASRTNDTTIVLDAATPLGANYSGSVTWQRSRYTFNRDFSKLHYLVDLANKYSLSERPVADLYEWRNVSSLAGDPTMFSVRGSAVAGATDIVIMPAPSVASQFEAMVTVTPRTPRIYKLAGSDGAITNGTNVFTSATTTFTPACVGAVLRFYSQFADIPYGIPTWEAFVTSVTDSHTLVLSETARATSAGAAFVVSSHVDIEPTLMLTYVMDEAFANYCLNTDHKGLPQAKAVAKESLLRAIAADARVNNSRGIQYNWINNYGMRLSDYAGRVITG